MSNIFAAQAHIADQRVYLVPHYYDISDDMRYFLRKNKYLGKFARPNDPTSIYFVAAWSHLSLSFAKYKSATVQLVYPRQRPSIEDAKAWNNLAQTKMREIDHWFKRAEALSPEMRQIMKRTNGELPHFEKERRRIAQGYWQHLYNYALAAQDPTAQLPNLESSRPASIPLERVREIIPPFLLPPIEAQAVNGRVPTNVLASMGIQV